MKIPRWKKWLSNFFSLRLEKVKSNYSGSLEIVLDKGRIALCTQNAMYSFEDLYLNFRESFSKLKLEEYKIEKVLLLGAGLLSVPIILEKLHNKKFSYKAVDIDPAVIKLAAKYAVPNLTSEVELICADALEFVKKEKEKYGLIIVDLFIDDTVPSGFETLEFLNLLKSLMNENSLLMFNRMAQNESALNKTEEFYNQMFKTVFDVSQMYILHANRMLIGSRTQKTESQVLT